MTGGITAHRYLNGAGKGLRDECFIDLSWFLEIEILLISVPIYKSSHAVVIATVIQYLKYSLRILVPSQLQILFRFTLFHTV
jgi:hypothetical protein